ncbi:hypothetical protein ALI22I_10575 [Saccharothrix sp. ALI-22-I]|nr:hypothetical protein ALI22I_10575 [Saccharothrix sp. ALI-22-I]
MRRWTIPMATAFVLLVTGLTTWRMWAWVASASFTGTDQRVTALLDVVKIGAAVAAAGGGVITLYLASRRQRTQELELQVRHAELRNRAAELVQRDRAQDHTEVAAQRTHDLAAQAAVDTREHAEAQRITELYTKASEQLGSEKAPVRLAGLYALERLAQDNPHQRQTIVNVLCAYLRMPFDAPTDAPGNGDDVLADHHRRVQEREVRVAAQRILREHLRPGDNPTVPATSFWPDIDLNLSGALLVDFDLSKCRLRSFTASSAIFDSGCTFHKANFTGDALFVGTRFNESPAFDNVRFESLASFGNARFSKNVRFFRTKFDERAVFYETHFDGDADFSAARFGTATFFTGALFNQAAIFQGAWFVGLALFSGNLYLGGPSFSTKRTDNLEDEFSYAARFSGEVYLNARFDGELSIDGCLFKDIEKHRILPPGLRVSDQHVDVEGLEGRWRQIVIDDDNEAKNSESSDDVADNPTQGTKKIHEIVIKGITAWDQD